MARLFLEETEQAVVIEWAAWQPAPFELEGKLVDYLFSIPNGAYLAGDETQRARQMERLKRTGLAPGAADLFLALPQGRRYHGYFIEMKKPLEAFPTRNRALASISAEQQIFGHNRLITAYLWSVCFGADEAISNIRAYIAGGTPTSEVRAP